MQTDQPTPESTDALTLELTRTEEHFNEAMVSNDPARISACVTDDWVLVTTEAGIIPGARILRVIETGELSHDTMTKDVARVRVYGDIAVVTSRGRNTGQFRGQRLSADEWVTDVYRRIGGCWLCVLTHLTPAAK